MLDFVQHRRKYFLFSALIIGIGLVAMAVTFTSEGSPFRLGVDFRSGTRFEVTFLRPASESQIRAAFVAAGLSQPSITSLGAAENATAWQIRTEFVAHERSQEILASLEAAIAPIDAAATSVQSVSPAIGGEVTRAAFIAIGVAAVIILLYIMFSFRQVTNSLRYGACAVIAMLHDLLVIFGFIAIMGLVAGWEVDALFLTAALTVAGFSLQDTIVVFDRIRENSRKRPNEDFELLVNRSIMETIHRSLVTQLNAMFVLVAVLLFGGASIRPFIAVLFIGLLSGTYSSLFNAVPLLVAWEKQEIPFLSRAQAS